ncbi:MAG: NAD(+)/NADH kinase [Lachnospiraceae bacterium]|jgi:NAD+ kinase|nr:NAD(+)/NADH kinase [Lachnospiraceae bacterium]
MDSFYIITNETKDRGLETTGRVKGLLAGYGKKCVDEAGQADCVLVLGGDGTMLKAAVDLADISAPMLGINLGNLGFLAEVEESQIESAIAQVIKGEYEIERRMMLTGSVNDGAGHDALNEVVIAGSKPMQLIYFDLYVKGLLLSSYVADGMIVSTATGSTAYNLSAGGPLVEPGANVLLLTPVCSHTLRNRSIILAPDEEVALMLTAGKYGEEQRCLAIFDGHNRVEIKSGDCLRIARSKRTTAIVKLSKMNFLEILKQKL